MKFKGFITGGHFVQQSRTICSTVLEGIMRNISTKLFLIWASGLEKYNLKIFLHVFLEIRWQFCLAIYLYIYYLLIVQFWYW